MPDAFKRGDRVRLTDDAIQRGIRTRPPFCGIVLYTPKNPHSTVSIVMEGHSSATVSRFHHSFIMRLSP